MRLIRTHAALLGVSLCSCTAAAQPEVFDNFNDGNDAGWVRFVDGLDYPDGPYSYDASSGAYTLSAAIGLPFGAEAEGPAAISNTSLAPRYSEGTWRVRFRLNSLATTAAIAARLRILPDESSVSYLLALNGHKSESMWLVKVGGRDASDDVLLATVSRAEVDVSVAADWFAELSTIGAEITFRAWPATSPRPAAPIRSLTDTDHASGQLALLAFKEPDSPSGRTSATFDDIEFTPAPPACPADFNRDGFVDFFDADDFVLAFESGDPRGDFNDDGFIDFFDFDDFVLAFETGC
jgi:hypothetical protein